MSDHKEDSVLGRRATEAPLLVRSCERLLGICAGFTSDGVLTGDEIWFLNLWLQHHKEVAETWPGAVVYRRARDILADGVIAEDERDYLVSMLSDLIEGTLENAGAAYGLSTGLPVDQTANVVIPEKYFCFAGAFLYGTPAACEHAVHSRGGEAIPQVTNSLDYLVIGTLASREWGHTSHGRKIEEAVKCRDDGADLLIVSEAQWASALA